MPTDRKLLRLFTWLSPAFPVGGYTYSHGIEYAVESGLVRDSESLLEWAEGILEFGAGRSDSMFFREAWEAASRGDAKALDKVAELAHVFRPSRELALENSAQGQAFLRSVSDTWPHPFLSAWHDRLASAKRSAAYPVAVAVVSALEEIPLDDALAAYLHAFAANLVSAGVRLIPLGQTAGLKTICTLEPSVLKARDAALKAESRDLGTAAPMVDWTSMRHETQYTRLFRS